MAEIERASALAGSLRKIRSRASKVWSGYMVAMTLAEVNDLAESVDLIEQMRAELAEWRSVFGHLGATPDDCGNALVEARRVPRELLTDAESASLAANGMVVS